MKEVLTKTFLDGFDDLERLYILWRELMRTKHEVNRIVLGLGIGSLENRVIFTEDEKERFMKLKNALDAASNLVYDKIEEQQRECVKSNVIGITESNDEVKEDTKEDETEFF